MSDVHEPVSLHLSVPGGQGALMCTEAADVASLPTAVLDAHVIVVSYGGEHIEIVYDTQADLPGLPAAVGRVAELAPEAVREGLVEAELDPDEAEALGRLDVALVEALGSTSPVPRRAVLAGYLLVALRRELRRAKTG